MPVTVAIAGPADAEALHAALQTLVPQLTRSSPPPTLDAVQAMLRHDAVTQLLARDDGGRIVGVATLAAFPVPSSTRAWVEDVIVDEASANQGIGRLLVEALIARARELGATTLDLTSRPSREAANHLYRSAGFEPRETNVYRYDLRP